MSHPHTFYLCQFLRLLNRDLSLNFIPILLLTYAAFVLAKIASFRPRDRINVIKGLKRVGLSPPEWALSRRSNSCEPARFNDV
jgi:hypothetical protein